MDLTQSSTPSDSLHQQGQGQGQGQETQQNQVHQSPTIATTPSQPEPEIQFPSATTHQTIPNRAPLPFLSFSRSYSRKRPGPGPEYAGNSSDFASIPMNLSNTSNTSESEPLSNSRVTQNEIYPNSTEISSISTIPTTKSTERGQASIHSTPRKTRASNKNNATTLQNNSFVFHLTSTDGVNVDMDHVGTKNVKNTDLTQNQTQIHTQTSSQSQPESQSQSQPQPKKFQYDTLVNEEFGQGVGQDKVKPKPKTIPHLPPQSHGKSSIETSIPSAHPLKTRSRSGANLFKLDKLATQPLDSEHGINTNVNTTTNTIAPTPTPTPPTPRKYTRIAGSMKQSDSNYDTSILDAFPTHLQRDISLIYPYISLYRTIASHTYGSKYLPELLRTPLLNLSADRIVARRDGTVLSYDMILKSDHYLYKNKQVYRSIVEYQRKLLEAQRHGNRNSRKNRKLRSRKNKKARKERGEKGEKEEREEKELKNSGSDTADVVTRDHDRGRDSTDLNLTDNSDNSENSDDSESSENELLSSTTTNIDSNLHTHSSTININTSTSTSTGSEWELFGAPNFRLLPGYSIAAVAQPTISGIRTVLNTLLYHQAYISQQNDGLDGHSGMKIENSDNPISNTIGNTKSNTDINDDAFTAEQHLANLDAASDIPRRNYSLNIIYECIETFLNIYYNQLHTRKHINIPAINPQFASQLFYTKGSENKKWKSQLQSGLPSDLGLDVMSVPPVTSTSSVAEKAGMIISPTISTGSNISLATSSAAAAAASTTGSNLPTGTNSNIFIQWINLREEPVVYLSGRPFVLRQSVNPFRNIADFQGISPARLCDVERQLAKDIIIESATRCGNILVHDEIKGVIRPNWTAIGSDILVKKCRNIFMYGKATETWTKQFKSLQFGVGGSGTVPASVPTSAIPTQATTTDDNKSTTISTLTPTTPTNPFSSVIDDDSDTVDNHLEQLNLVLPPDLVFKMLRQREMYRIALTRIPITADHAPKSLDFDRLVRAIIRPYEKRRVNEEIYFVFNCQQGAGRSTLGSIVCGLILSCIHGFTKNQQEVKTIENAVNYVNTMTGIMRDSIIKTRDMVSAAATADVDTENDSTSSATATSITTSTSASIPNPHQPISTFVNSSMSSMFNSNIFNNLDTDADDIDKEEEKKEKEMTHTLNNTSPDSFDTTGFYLPQGEHIYSQTTTTTTPTINPGSSLCHAVSLHTFVSALKTYNHPETAHPTELRTAQHILLSLPSPPWVNPIECVGSSTYIQSIYRNTKYAVKQRLRLLQDIHNQGSGKRFKQSKLSKQSKQRLQYEDDLENIHGIAPPLTSTTTTTSAIDEPVVNPLLLEHLQVISRLVRMLKFGPAVKKEVDSIIDQASELQNLRYEVLEAIREIDRDDIITSEDRLELIEKAEKKLRRYVMLLCFHEYLREQQLHVMINTQRLHIVQLQAERYSKELEDVEMLYMQTVRKSEITAKQLVQLTTSVSGGNVPLVTTPSIGSVGFEYDQNQITHPHHHHHSHTHSHSHAHIEHLRTQYYQQLDIVQQYRTKYTQLHQQYRTFLREHRGQKLQSNFTRAFFQRLVSHPFSRWLAKRPDLYTLAEGSGLNLYEIRNQFKGTDTHSIAETFVASRNGSLLSRGTVLKLDILPPSTAITGVGGIGAAGAGVGSNIQVDETEVQDQRTDISNSTALIPSSVTKSEFELYKLGLPRLRTLSSVPLIATAQPTTMGIKALVHAAYTRYEQDFQAEDENAVRLDMIQSKINDYVRRFRLHEQKISSQSSSDKPHSLTLALENNKHIATTPVLWFNLREEPVLFIKGIPFTLREETHPLRLLPEFLTGISGSVLEDFELRLKSDVVAELVTTKNILVPLLPYLKHGDTGGKSLGDDDGNINGLLVHEEAQTHGILHSIFNVCDDTVDLRQVVDNTKKAKSRKVVLEGGVIDDVGDAHVDGDEDEDEGIEENKTQELQQRPSSHKSIHSHTTTRPIPILSELDNQLYPVLMSDITPNDIQTPSEVYKSLRSEGIPISYHRIPLYADETPLSDSLSQLFQLIDHQVGGKLREVLPINAEREMIVSGLVHRINLLYDITKEASEKLSSSGIVALGMSAVSGASGSSGATTTTTDNVVSTPIATNPINSPNNATPAIVMRANMIASHDWFSILRQVPLPNVVVNCRRGSRRSTFFLVVTALIMKHNKTLVLESDIEKENTRVKEREKEKEMEVMKEKREKQERKERKERQEQEKATAAELLPSSPILDSSIPTSTSTSTSCQLHCKECQENFTRQKSKTISSQSRPITQSRQSRQSRTIRPSRQIQHHRGPSFDELNIYAEDANRLVEVSKKIRKQDASSTATESDVLNVSTQDNIHDIHDIYEDDVYENGYEDDYTTDMYSKIKKRHQKNKVHGGGRPKKSEKSLVKYRKHDDDDDRDDQLSLSIPSSPNTQTLEVFSPTINISEGEREDGGKYPRGVQNLHHITSSEGEDETENDGNEGDDDNDNDNDNGTDLGEDVDGEVDTNADTDTDADADGDAEIEDLESELRDDEDVDGDNFVELYLDADADADADAEVDDTDNTDYTDYTDNEDVTTAKTFKIGGKKSTSTIQGKDDADTDVDADVDTDADADVDADADIINCPHCGSTAIATIDESTTGATVQQQQQQLPFDPFNPLQLTKKDTKIKSLYLSLPKPAVVADEGYINTFETEDGETDTTNSPDSTASADSADDSTDSTDDRDRNIDDSTSTSESTSNTKQNTKTKGTHRAVLRLIRILRRGRSVKEELDEVISLCGTEYHLTDSILQSMELSHQALVNKNDSLAKTYQSRASRYLEAYCLLICFNAYLRERTFYREKHARIVWNKTEWLHLPIIDFLQSYVPEYSQSLGMNISSVSAVSTVNVDADLIKTKNPVSLPPPKPFQFIDFTKWLLDHPELLLILQHIQNPQHQEESLIIDQLDDKSIEKSEKRNGHVLGRGAILKADAFAGITNEAIKPLSIGVTNFRFAPQFPVAGTGIPTYIGLCGTMSFLTGLSPLEQKFEIHFAKYQAKLIQYCRRMDMTLLQEAASSWFKRRLLEKSGTASTGTGSTGSGSTETGSIHIEEIPEIDESKEMNQMKQIKGHNVPETSTIHMSNYQDDTISVGSTMSVTSATSATSASSASGSVVTAKSLLEPSMLNAHEIKTLIEEYNDLEMSIDSFSDSDEDEEGDNVKPEGKDIDSGADADADVNAAAKDKSMKKTRTRIRTRTRETDTGDNVDVDEDSKSNKTVKIVSPKDLLHLNNDQDISSPTTYHTIRGIEDLHKLQKQAEREKAEREKHESNQQQIQFQSQPQSTEMKPRQRSDINTLTGENDILSSSMDFLLLPSSNINTTATSAGNDTAAGSSRSLSRHLFSSFRELDNENDDENDGIEIDSDIDADAATTNTSKHDIATHITNVSDNSDPDHSDSGDANDDSHQHVDHRPIQPTITMSISRFPSLHAHSHSIPPTSSNTSFSSGSSLSSLQAPIVSAIETSGSGSGSGSTSSVVPVHVMAPSSAINSHNEPIPSASTSTSASSHPVTATTNEALSMLSPSPRTPLTHYKPSTESHIQSQLRSVKSLQSLRSLESLESQSSSEPKSQPQQPLQSIQSISSQGSLKSVPSTESIKSMTDSRPTFEQSLSTLSSLSYIPTNATANANAASITDQSTADNVTDNSIQKIQKLDKSDITNINVNTHDIPDSSTVSSSSSSSSSQVSQASQTSQTSQHSTHTYSIPQLQEQTQISLSMNGLVPPGYTHVLWFNLREEPVVFIKGRPFVLREHAFPYQNLEHTGISTKRVEGMEKQLKRDIVREAMYSKDCVMLHDEDRTGTLIALESNLTHIDHEAVMTHQRDLYYQVDTKDAMTGGVAGMWTASKPHLVHGVDEQVGQVGHTSTSTSTSSIKPLQLSRFKIDEDEFDEKLKPIYDSSASVGSSGVDYNYNDVNTLEICQSLERNIFNLIDDSIVNPLTSYKPGVVQEGNDLMDQNSHNLNSLSLSLNVNNDIVHINTTTDVANRNIHLQYLEQLASIPASTSTSTIEDMERIIDQKTLEHLHLSTYETQKLLQHPGPISAGINTGKDLDALPTTPGSTSTTKSKNINTNIPSTKNSKKNMMMNVGDSMSSSSLSTNTSISTPATNPLISSTAPVKHNSQQFPIIVGVEYIFTLICKYIEYYNKQYQSLVIGKHPLQVLFKEHESIRSILEKEGVMVDTTTTTAAVAAPTPVTEPTTAPAPAPAPIADDNLSTLSLSLNTSAPPTTTRRPSVLYREYEKNTIAPYIDPTINSLSTTTPASAYYPDSSVHGSATATGSATSVTATSALPTPTSPVSPLTPISTHSSVYSVSSLHSLQRPSTSNLTTNSELGGNTEYIINVHNYYYQCTTQLHKNYRNIVPPFYFISQRLFIVSAITAFMNTLFLTNYRSPEQMFTEKKNYDKKKKQKQEAAAGIVSTSGKKDSHGLSVKSSKHKKGITTGDSSSTYLHRSEHVYTDKGHHHKHHHTQHQHSSHGKHHEHRVPGSGSVSVSVSSPNNPKSPSLRPTQLLTSHEIMSQYPIPQFTADVTTAATTTAPIPNSTSTTYSPEIYQKLVSRYEKFTRICYYSASIYPYLKSHESTIYKSLCHLLTSQPNWEHIYGDSVLTSREAFLRSIYYAQKRHIKYSIYSPFLSTFPYSEMHESNKDMFGTVNTGTASTVIPVSIPYIKYCRTPITDEQAPAPSVIDSMIENLENINAMCTQSATQQRLNDISNLDPTSDNNNINNNYPLGRLSIVTNCQMGRGRTTTGMVIACLWLIISNHISVDLSTLGVVEAPVMIELRTVMTSVDKTTAKAAATGTKPSALTSNIPPVPTTCQTRESLAQQLREGQYPVVRSLLQLLPFGTEAKFITDKIIDCCGEMQNLRITMYDVEVLITKCPPNKIAANTAKGRNFLIRYIYLICVTSYLLHQRQVRQLYNTFVIKQREELFEKEIVELQEKYQKALTRQVYPHGVVIIEGKEMQDGDGDGDGGDIKDENDVDSIQLGKPEDYSTDNPEVLRKMKAFTYSDEKIIELAFNDDNNTTTTTPPIELPEKFQHWIQRRSEITSLVRNMNFPILKPALDKLEREHERRELQSASQKLQL